MNDDKGKSLTRSWLVGFNDSRAIRNDPEWHRYLQTLSSPSTAPATVATVASDEVDNNSVDFGVAHSFALIEPSLGPVASQWQTLLQPFAVELHSSCLSYFARWFTRVHVCMLRWIVSQQTAAHVYTPVVAVPLFASARPSLLALNERFDARARVPPTSNQCGISLRAWMQRHLVTVCTSKTACRQRADCEFVSLHVASHHGARLWLVARVHAARTVRRARVSCD